MWHNASYPIVPNFVNLRYSKALTEDMTLDLALKVENKFVGFIMAFFYVFVDMCIVLDCVFQPEVNNNSKCR